MEINLEIGPLLVHTAQKTPTLTCDPLPGKLYFFRKYYKNRNKY